LVNIGYPIIFLKKAISHPSFPIFPICPHWILYIWYIWYLHLWNFTSTLLGLPTGFGLSFRENWDFFRVLGIGTSFRLLKVVDADHNGLQPPIRLSGGFFPEISWEIPTIRCNPSRGRNLRTFRGGIFRGPGNTGPWRVVYVVSFCFLYSSGGRERREARSRRAGGRRERRRETETEHGGRQEEGGRSTRRGEPGRIPTEVAISDTSERLEEGRESTRATTRETPGPSDKAGRWAGDSCEAAATGERTARAVSRASQGNQRGET